MRTTGLEVLNSMQDLYEDAWDDWFGWKNQNKLSLFARTEDPGVLNGRSLVAAGRSHAMELLAFSESQHAAGHRSYIVTDIDDHMQVFF